MGAAPGILVAVMTMKRLAYILFYLSIALALLSGAGFIYTLVVDGIIHRRFPGLLAYVSLAGAYFALGMVATANVLLLDALASDA